MDAARPSDRTEHERGATIVEMIVATMILAVGVVAVAGSLNTASKADSVADHRTDAARLMTTEIETIRSRPYAEIGIAPSSRGYRRHFENRPTVTEAVNRVEASGSEEIGSVSYEIDRDVTWSGISVGATSVPEGYKVISIRVTWSDAAGTHDLRQDTGLYRPDANA